MNKMWYCKIKQIDDINVVSNPKCCNIETADNIGEYGLYVGFTFFLDYFIIMIKKY